MSDPSNTPHSVGWTNNSINAGGNPRHPPNVDLNVFVNALMHQVPAQLALSNTVAISQQLLQQVSDIVRANLAPLCALLTTAAGMAILLPSLAVAIVNLVGFTSGGVLAGARFARSVRSEFVCSLSAVFVGWRAVRESRGAYSVDLLWSSDGRCLLSLPSIRCDGGDCVTRGIGGGRGIAGCRSRLRWLGVIQET